MPAEEFRKLSESHEILIGGEYHEHLETILETQARMINKLIDELSVIEANQQHVLNFIRENLPEARKSNLT